LVFARIVRKRSFNRVLGETECLCLKLEGYWLGSAMRQGSNAS